MSKHNEKPHKLKLVNSAKTNSAMRGKIKRQRSHFRKVLDDQRRWAQIARPRSNDLIIPREMATDECLETARTIHYAISNGKLYKPAELLALLKRGHGIVSVPLYFRAITGNGDASLILAQLMYWRDKSAEGKSRGGVIYTDGETRQIYIAKTYAEWAQETGMPNGRAAERATAKLRKKGLVLASVHKYGGLTQLHLAPNMPTIAAAIAGLWQAESDRRDAEYEKYIANHPK